MKNLPLKSGSESELIVFLENEIEALEKELASRENDLNIFEAKIRYALSVQIKRIILLTERYKLLKAEKKTKRLEQRKKGKNYKEPVGITKPITESFEDELIYSDKSELRRLFKEAIVHVHPDKFVNADEEQTIKANSLTAQLNHLYRSGDLKELSNFHQHIVSGNAISHVSHKSIPDPILMIAYLKRNRDDLLLELDEIKQSAIYKEFLSGKDPLIFIDELRIQFDQRIQQLEKRTRKFKEAQ